MASEPNFLLANGERLTEPVDVPSSPSDKQPPYDFDEARDRVSTMLESTVGSLDALPDLACPHDQAVFRMTLHPEYLAKSYYPGGIMSSARLRTVGSRLVEVIPDRRSRGRKPELAPALDLYVAGERSSIRSWSQSVAAWTLDERGAEELTRIEAISPLDAKARTRLAYCEAGQASWFEVVLHTEGGGVDDYVVSGFKEYLRSLDIESDLDRRFYVGGLCFVRLQTIPEHIADIAQFSFLRVARRMPKLRMQPMRITSNTDRRSVSLPDQPSVNSDIRVAVFDGGLRPDSPLEKWTDVYEFDGATAIDECMDHGETVTSALLFGSLPDGEAPVPFADVDHYQVLDDQSLKDSFELFEVLDRVSQILESNNYSFINLSFGPDLPIEDDDVHAWTAVLDEYLSRGQTLATIAIGNTGNEPEIVQDARRIQVPSDCVNGLSVGAADRRDAGWCRADYSSIGPGRSPGTIKPDLVAFGGSDQEAFWVTDPNNPSFSLATAGTSYSAPATMRTALALRSTFGSRLQPLALKALLVHGVDCGDEARFEVGWGRVPDDADSLVTCPEGVVRILYQDTLMPGRFLRARIPLPKETLQGRVTITATLCYATPVDPEHPASYTRGGLRVRFRPHCDKFGNEDARHPSTDSFFSADEFETEAQRRRDAHEWETCRHRSKGKLGKSLKEPCFDIHYNARREGRNDTSAERIPYALVITVKAPREPDLYDRVVQRYGSVLRPVQPVTKVRVRG